MSLDSSSSSNLHMTPSNRSVTPYTSCVEDHASQLIDELFQDIEYELDGMAPRPSASQSVTKSSSLLSLHQRTAALDTEEVGLLVPYLEMGATLESFYDPQPAQRGPIVEDSNHNFIQGLLFGITCLSLIGSVGLWMTTQWIHQSSVPPVATQPSPASAPLLNPADVEFANEAEQVLQIAEQTPAAPATVPAIATTALPSITSNAPPTLASPQLSVSTPPTQLAPVQPSTPKLKSTQMAPPPLKTQPVVLPSLQPIALNTVAQPILPKLATPTAPSSSPILSNLVPQALPIGRQGKVGVTVQGILDLGDKSAMLIARNGSTQNIKPGEVLDSTGWVFLRVEKGQAIIQRGNEVRAVSGGEEF